jgi:predicted PurR-regulated permease PerM
MTNVLRPVIPPRWRDEYDTFVQDVNTTYSSYIRGYFYVVALGTVMSGVLLFGFQVPSAALWLVAVLLLRLLPFIGGTLADLLLVLVFIFSLPLTSMIAALALIAIGQTILTNVLMPRVMSRELGINPLLVLFAVLLGGRIYGLAGVLFSIPAAAIIATIIGKAVKRYLLPLYETGGWWTEQVTVMQQKDRRSGIDRRGVPREDAEPRESAPPAYALTPRPVESARPAEHPIPSKEASDAA